MVGELIVAASAKVGAGHRPAPDQHAPQHHGALLARLAERVPPRGQLDDRLKRWNRSQRHGLARDGPPSIVQPGQRSRPPRGAQR
jgi:hypothetical protein